MNNERSRPRVAPGTASKLTPSTTRSQHEHTQHRRQHTRAHAVTWFRVDDNLCGNKKPRRAGLAAMGLWTIAGSYSSQQGLGGFIPQWYVETWPSGLKLATKLVEAGLWSPSEHDGDAGWEFHDWEQCNPSREKVEQDRSAARKRMRAKRSGEQDGCSDDVRANTHRTDDGCSHGVLAGAHTRTSAARPDPTRPVLESQERSSAAPPQPTVVDLLFDRFWKIYPRHEAKAAARKAFAKAVKVAEPRVILEGAARYREDPNRDPAFTAHPSTWLNKGQWDDEPLPSQAPRLRAVAGDPTNLNKEW